jgi:hypothetical protein
MPLQSRQTVVTVKSQSSAGSAASITIGTDNSLRVLGTPTWEPIGEQLIERGDMSSSAGGVVGPVVGSQGWRVQFQTEDYGFTDLTDETTSPLAPLWEASGKVETLTTPDRVRWTPKCGQVFGTDLTYVTIQMDEIGGNKYVLYDGVASVTSEAEAGGRLVHSWTVEGKWATPVASTVSAGDETYGTEPTPSVLKTSVSFTSGISGTVTGLSSFTADYGTEIVTRPVATATGAMDPSFLARSSTGPVLGVTIDADDDTSLAVWAEAVGTTTESRSLAYADGESNTVTLAWLDSFVRLPQRGGDTFRTYDLEIVGTTESVVDPVYVTWS